jgi:hypothetical protein
MSLARFDPLRERDGKKPPRFQRRSMKKTPVGSALCIGSRHTFGATVAK